MSNESYTTLYSVKCVKVVNGTIQNAFVLIDTT
jgi:hypothetical protein